VSDAEISPSVTSPPLTGMTGEIPMLSLFVFTVDQVPIGAFSEISGLELRAELVTYNEGGVNDFVHQLPGRFTWPNITLKQGVINNDNLFNWVSSVSGSGFAKNGNKVARSTGAISLIGSSSGPLNTQQGNTLLKTWNLAGVIPVRWAGPRLSIGSNEQATEELEIAHQGFTVTTPTGSGS
jgi:phage tail-like protein